MSAEKAPKPPRGVNYIASNILLQHLEDLESGIISQEDVANDFDPKLNDKKFDQIMARIAKLTEPLRKQLRRTIETWDGKAIRNNGGAVEVGKLKIDENGTTVPDC